jgi:hypothetical protein
MKPLDFIKSCISNGRIYWTYHVNMRLRERHIPRQSIISSVDTYEVIEEYKDDKYLPSYLIYATHANEVFHLHVAMDINNDVVIIITAYKPSSDKWESNGKTRRML